MSSSKTTSSMKNARLFQFLSHLSTPFSSFAITTAEDQLLFLKKQTLHEIGTLPAAIELCSQYFPIMDGDVVITNDPYSGGHLPSTIMVIMGVAVAGTGAADFYFVTPVAFKPKVSLAKSVEDEGLRVPPTPILQEQSLNTELLQIIGATPIWPANFRERIEHEVQKLKLSRLLFKKIKSLTGLSFNKAELQNYFKWSALKSRQFLNELPDGDFFSETPVGENEFIKLRLEVSDGRVLFDYSRTDHSQTLHITSPCTFGSSVGALLSLVNPDLPLNSGLLQHFEILSSQGSIVHAQFPQPVTQGLIDGPTLLANLVLNCFSKTLPQTQKAAQSRSNSPFEIEFENHHFFDFVPPGSPAQKNQPGISGINFWALNKLEPSIEEVERRYPILIKTYGFRNDSGGNGAFSGGDGLIKTVQVLSPSRFRWILTENDKPEGLNGGKSAQGPEIQWSSQGEKTHLTSLRGEQDHQAGDIISFFSAGGGGYGEKT